MEPPMTVKELSDYLRLDRMTIYKMLKEGTIPASRIGHQWRFLREDIDKWIRAKSIRRPVTILTFGIESELLSSIQREWTDVELEFINVQVGDEAVDVLSKRQIGLACIEISDAALDIFRRLREVEPKLPIVILANSPGANSIEAAMAIGAFTLINKPESLEEMAELLAALQTKTPFNP